MNSWSGIFTIGILLSTVPLAKGQDYLRLEGKIMDGKSRLALPYANIVVKNSSFGTISNESGEFRLVAPTDLRNDTLIVSYVGYRSFTSPIAALKLPADIYLEEAPVILRDVIVSSSVLTAEHILMKALDNLLQNSGYPNSDFKLEGFYREIHKTNNKTFSVVEAAFNVYDSSCTHPLKNIEILEFRKMLSIDQVRNKLYNHNNLLMLLGVSTNFVVLARQGLKTGKTTWAIGKRPYEIEDKLTYRDNEVYIISHVNNEVSLKLIINADNFSVLKSEYHSKQMPTDYDGYFWKYRNGNSRCGFYETHQVYEYREYQGKMYPYVFVREDYAKCFNPKTSVIESENVDSYQALFSNIVLRSSPPIRFEKMKKSDGMRELNYDYHPEFWGNYNIIKEMPLDEAIQRELEAQE